jgi:hypothetical protein
MNRSYIKIVGNLSGGSITGTTATTTTNIEQIRTKMVNIGGWNMNTNIRTRVVSTDVLLCKVRGVTASIRSDSGEIFPLTYPNGNWELAGCLKVCNTPTINTTVEIGRNDGYFFDQSAFGNAINNRGWIAIQYSTITGATLTTGTVSALAGTSFNVDNNIVTNNGNAPICEYGVVYSQATSNPTISSCKVCTVGAIAVGTPYTKTISGLQDSTLTYFRAYARNCEEIGYGIIKSCTTAVLPLPTLVTINLNQINNFGIQTDGYVDISPSLGLGQYICMSVVYHQTVADFGCSQIRMYCRPNGNPFFSEITAVIDPAFCMCTDSVQFCRNGGGQAYIGYGDCLCYINFSDGNTGSCSDFSIHPFSSSIGLSVITGSCNVDCIVN